nr:MAG TPA: hypothetical protein [Bacteriophage sp.]
MRSSAKQHLSAINAGSRQPFSTALNTAHLI